MAKKLSLPSGKTILSVLVLIAVFVSLAILLSKGSFGATAQTHFRDLRFNHMALLITFAIFTLLLALFFINTKGMSRVWSGLAWVLLFGFMVWKSFPENHLKPDIETSENQRVENTTVFVPDEDVKEIVDTVEVDQVKVLEDKALALESDIQKRDAKLDEIEKKKKEKCSRIERLSSRIDSLSKISKGQDEREKAILEFNCSTPQPDTKKDVASNPPPNKKGKGKGTNIKRQIDSGTPIRKGNKPEDVAGLERAQTDAEKRANRKGY